MFFRRARGLFDFAMALLCVAAALHLTPAGAVVRKLGALLIGERSTSGPLLSYYSGGGSSGDAAGFRLALPPRAQVPLPGQLGPSQALSYGVFLALKDLGPGHRSGAEETLRKHGLELAKVADEKKGPRELELLISKLSSQLGSEDAAVASLFFGWEAARYAKERCEAGGGGAVTLERMAKHLPPGFEEETGAAALAMALGTAYGLGWPVAESTPITSGFGERDHPLLGGKRLHTGVDLGLPIGSPVRAVADGVVRRASEDPVNGRVLIIDHGNGVSTAYCHNSKLKVEEGALVQRGDLIAESGNTGRSTGPHLHYQVELGETPVDPLRFAVVKQRAKVVSGGE